MILTRIGIMIRVRFNKLLGLGLGIGKDLIRIRTWNNTINWISIRNLLILGLVSAKAKR